MISAWFMSHARLSAAHPYYSGKDEIEVRRDMKDITKGIIIGFVEDAVRSTHFVDEVRLCTTI